MAYFRHMLVYLWALFAVPIILVTFMGGGYWASKLVSVTGIKVSPWLTGGDIFQIINHGQYRTFIHQPVFEGLIGPRKRGFIQIDWREEAGFLPGILNEMIDYNRDGLIDFKIQFDTKKNQARLINKKSNINEIEAIYQLDHGRAVRVSLKNQ
jgi:hypothetical protein